MAAAPFKAGEEMDIEEKFNEFYGGYDEENAEDIEDELEDELSCDNCGPWCEEWMGDGLCNLVIKEQTRQSAEYNRKHTGERNCPICKKRLKRYDCVNVNELWTWCPDPYDPIIALNVLGPIWLKKGEIHHKGNLYHVWIEWGDGKEERLIRLLPKKARKGTGV